MSTCLQDAGFQFAFDPIKVKFKPSAKDMQVAEESGTDLAQLVRKKLKQKEKQASFQPTKAGLPLPLKTSENPRVTGLELPSWKPLKPQQTRATESGGCFRGTRTADLLHECKAGFMHTYLTTTASGAPARWSEYDANLFVDRHVTDM